MPLKTLQCTISPDFVCPPKTALSPQTSIRLLPQANPDYIWKLRLPCHPTLLLPSFSAQTSYLLPAYRPVLHTQISLFYVPSMPYIYNLPGCTDIEISGIKFHSHRILSFYVPFLRRDLHSCSHHFGQTDFYHTPALLLYSLTLTSLFCISCTLIARMTGTSF